MQNFSETYNTNDYQPFAGGGTCGALMRSIDWSKSKLGPVETWPQSLIGALSICLNCQFPIAIYWGKDKILFYNDAWRPIVGNKHPDSYGRPGREVWPEIWDVIGPLFEHVDSTGEGNFSANQLLLMHRHGYTEECYFDFTFSPIKEVNGSVGGIFNAVLETTFRSLSERRAKTLSDLATRGSAAQLAQENCRLSAQVLAENPADVPFSVIYLNQSINQEQAQFEFAACSGVDSERHSSLISALKTGPVNEVYGSHRSLVLTDFEKKFGSIVGDAWPEPIDNAYAIPLLRKRQQGDVVMGVVVVGVSPRRELNQEYKNFFEQLGHHVATHILNALSYQEERKRAEDLVELDRTKTQFFSNVSHEFRTPLTLMLGPLEENLMNLENLPATYREREQPIYRNALRLLKLVNALLDFSRIEAGRMKASYGPTHLDKVTTDLASVFRSAIEKAGLSYHVDIATLDEHAYVDVGMWEKIIFNLLSNALKFTLNGSIKISLKKVDSKFQLSVRDTGIGIPEAELSKLFERFHRVDGAHGRTHEGTGIGLALTQELVKLHGGRIWAQSEFGKGSEFILELPLGKDHLPKEHFAENISAEQVVQSLGQAFVEEAQRWLPEADRPLSAPALGYRARILLVDDNADMRQYVKDLLQKYWQVEVAADGEAALDLLKRENFDLVLSDIMMPKLDGFGLLKQIRTNPKMAGLPIILLSARAGEEARVEGLEAGADDYLIKPFSGKELMARVSTHLKIASMRKEAQLVETQLREEKFRFEQVAEATELGVWYCDLPFDSLIWNAKTKKHFWLTPNTNVNIDLFYERIHPEDREPTRAAIERSIEMRGKYDVEYRTTNPSNHQEYKWIRAIGWTDYDQAGNPKRFDGITLDVSERKRMETALKEREAYFRNLVDMSPAILWLTDPDASCTYLSKQWYEFTGRTPEQDLGS